MKGKIVEQIYKKVDNIDDKVKEANMPYMQWKVLFLVGENTNADEISSLLEEDASTVEEILTSLESKSLIEKVGELQPDAGEEKRAPEESVPTIGDELLMEEEEAISQVDEKLETEEHESEEETVAEEPEIETEPEASVPDLEESAAETQEESITELDTEVEEEMFNVEEESTDQKEMSAPEVTLPEEISTDKPSETDTDSVEDDEYDLSIDEPAVTTTAAEEPAPAKPEDVETVDEEIISDSTRKTVMVIDDSIVIRKMIEIALEEEDFNIITAISGKEGLETIEKEKPNLVILDMMLPDMNGIEVLKIIKTEKKLPVIMLSGKDSPQLIETAKEVGVDDFLPKPFRDEELVEKVKTLIEV
jgi:CheY-like chemotaxis protein